MFPTAPARFQGRSARVTTSCGFHLAHGDLRRDRISSKQLRCVPRPASPSGLLGEFLITFPSGKEKTLNAYYQESLREREWPLKAQYCGAVVKRDIRGCGLRVREDKFVVQISRNPHISCEFKSSWLHPSFTTDFWQEEKLSRAQSDKGISIFHHRASWHLIFRDSSYQRDPETPVREEALPEVQVALLEGPKSCHLFSPLHLTAFDFFNAQHPCFKRWVSSGPPSPDRPTDLLWRDMCGMGRVEVLLRLWSTSNTCFPPAGISSFMPGEDWRWKRYSVPHFAGRLIPSLWAHGAPSG